LIELDLDYATQPIRTRTPAMEDPAFMALHPRGKIPVLVDGDLVVSESAAIVTYLAETYGSDANPLIPAAYGARAKYFEWMSFISMELDATSLYVLRRHVDLHETYGEAPAANDTAREYFLRMIQSVVPALPSEGNFLLGHAFSGADILMLSCLNFSDRYDIALPAEVAAYRERVSARPAYQAALEANNP
jgi:glutathione S-transferase